MVEFSGGAVIAMLAIVESTVVALYVRLGAKKADDEDVDEVEEDVEQLEAETSQALREIRDVERDVEAVARRVEEVVATDGGPEHDHDHD